MGQQSAGQPHRASLPRFASRAVVLAALGTGLWLGGQTSASAEELTTPATAVPTMSAAVDAAPEPSLELLPPATSAVDLAADLTAHSVARAAETAPVPVAPAAPVPVAPVVSAAVPAVQSAVVPVIDLADPVVQAAQPVLQAAAPVRDIAATVVAAVEQPLAPLTEVVPLAGAVHPLLAPETLLAPTADALAPVLITTGTTGGLEPPDADSHASTEAVDDAAAGIAGAGRVMARAGADVVTSGLDEVAGVPAPVPPALPAPGGPAAVGCTGSHSFDQSPVDLSAAVPAMFPAASVATGDARDGAGDIALDPSFSPD